MVKSINAMHAGEVKVFFGLGDKTCGVNLAGKKFQNWCTDSYGFGRESDPLYRAITAFNHQQFGINTSIHIKIKIGVEDKLTTRQRRSVPANEPPGARVTQHHHLLHEVSNRSASAWSARESTSTAARGSTTSTAATVQPARRPMVASAPSAVSRPNR